MIDAAIRYHGWTIGEGREGGTLDEEKDIGVYRGIGWNPVRNRDASGIEPSSSAIASETYIKEVSEHFRLLFAVFLKLDLYILDI